MSAKRHGSMPGIRQFQKRQRSLILNDIAHSIPSEVRDRRQSRLRRCVATPQGKPCEQMDVSAERRRLYSERLFLKRRNIKLSCTGCNKVTYFKTLSNTSPRSFLFVREGGPRFHRKGRKTSRSAAFLNFLKTFSPPSICFFPTRAYWRDRYPLFPAKGISRRGNLEASIFRRFH